MGQDLGLQLNRLSQLKTAGANRPFFYRSRCCVVIAKLVAAL